MDEPGNWEDHYLRGQTPWDKGAASPGLEAYLEKHAVSGSVLVPGCGLGHDVRALARGGAEVMGLDIAPSAIEKADAIEKEGNESYRVGDLFAGEEDLLGVFDWVWEHTCFCAIEPGRRADYVAAVKGMLKEGGRLLGVFYVNPYDEEHQPGAGPPHGCPVGELEALFSSDFRIESSWVPEVAYEGREGREWMAMMTRLGGDNA